MAGCRKYIPLLLLLFVPLVAVDVGCSDEQGDAEQSCRPGRTIECYCMDGRRGSQRCFIDGSQYGPCQCRDDSEEDAGCVGSGCAQDTIEDQRAPDGSSDPGCVGSSCVPDEVVEEPDQSTEEPDRRSDEDRSEEDPGRDTGRDRADDDVATGSRLLGEDCDRASHCASDICLGFNMGAGFFSVCAEPCCHENECPFGFGCLQGGAGRYCLPSRIFPAGYTFTGATGESCGVTGDACKSGLCDGGRDECLGSCCTDDECVAFPCHWSQTGSTQRTFCDRNVFFDPYFEDLAHGAGCVDGRQCHSGVCAETSPGVGQCAALCCSTSACPAGTGCGLVGGLGGAVTRACVPLTTGSSPNGSACSDDGESCLSGHCVENACRQLCCTDADCTSPERCLPRTTSEDVLAPVCTPPDG